VGVPRLREIATPFEFGRHAPLVQAPGVGARQEILRPEEEQLVATAVEARAWNQNRPAQRPRGVVEGVQRRLALCRDTLAALLAPQVLVAVPGVVALVEGGAATEVFRAAARHDGDRGARASAVLGLE